MKTLVTLLCFSLLLFMATNGHSEQAGPRIRLPEAVKDGTKSLEKCISQRRSVRSFSGEAITLEQVGQLLWAGQGITGPQRGLRAAPSAGALYPLEFYVVAARVRGLEPGIYRYYPAGHELGPVVTGDRKEQLAQAAYQQMSIVTAPAALVIAAVYERTVRKYGERGTRYVHMDAGAAAENVFLEVVAQGLGTVIAGSFDDEGVRRAVGMARDERALLIMPVGIPR